MFSLCIATMMLPWQVTMVPLFIIFKISAGSTRRSICR